jgi:hypothetical protein
MKFTNHNADRCPPRIIHIDLLLLPTFLAVFHAFCAHVVCLGSICRTQAACFESIAQANIRQAIPDLWGTSEGDC